MPKTSSRSSTQTTSRTTNKQTPSFTMPAFLQNKYIRIGGIGLLAVLATIIVFSVLASLSTSRSFSDMGFVGTEQVDKVSLPSERFAESEAVSDSAYGSTPVRPRPSGYTANLERYELTDYQVTAQTRHFAELCDLLVDLKSDDTIDFQSISESTNRCQAHFYVDEADTQAIVSQFAAYDDVELNRTTQSVTRHRERIASQTEILREQLASVEQSLAIAQTEFDEIATFAREANDAATLSEAIREKLSLVDTLTNRKISLTAALDEQLQAAADLNERIGVVQFSVTISRAFPQRPNEFTRQWANAWEDLKDTFTDTLIGLTTVFGIFLLWLLRGVVYGVVIIVVIRLLWKFGRYLWKQW